MGDYKDAYSEASQYYVEHTVPSSDLDQSRYQRSKQREEKFNELWKKNAVNINEICDVFAPGDRGYKDGVKFIFEGERFRVKADMASGYLRIYDKSTSRYVRLDGSAGTLEQTHFKILKREEM